MSLAVLAATAYLLLTTAPRLGLDLKGGTQVVLETQDSPTTKADADVTDRTLEVLRNRVDELGVAEPVLARSGENRVVVELPGLQDPQEALDVIGRTAQLSFHPVLDAGPGVEPSSKPAADGSRATVDEDGRPLRLGPTALTGDGVDRARSGADPQGAGSIVTVEFTDGDRWRKLTGDAACAPAGDPQRRVAIVLDDKVISSPQVDPGVGCGAGIPGGSTTITGNFTGDEARELSTLISGGALPVPVEVVEQRTVGPTLGAEAIDDSAQAAVIGLALTGLFLMAVYWLSGLIAVVALLGYAAIAYAGLLAVGATLTLPGLAGFVLAIGMAVDATVLVFERTREEHARGRLTQAVDRGFKGAMSAIVDSNVTTLIAAGLLFWLASGPVKGFGVTLAIGVVASMFTCLVLTRVLLQFALAAGLNKRPKWSGLTHQGRVRRWIDRQNPGFLSRPRRWLAGAGAVVGLALVGLIVAGPTLGVEFTGGRVLEYRVSGPVDVDGIRASLTDAGFGGAVVQASGEDTVSVRTGPVDQAATRDIRAAVADVTQDAEQVRDEKIGPSLGAELRNNALVALGLAVLAQLLYLAVRFDWRLGVATVVALVQDVLVIIGVFAWLGKTLDGVFLAALLTVIGYSVNDSVVVFDRVRELRRERPGESFARNVGGAVLQTLPRTVNTGIGVLFVLGALLLLGDGSLADFALALLLGLIAGTLSTIATAGPVAILLERRHPAPRAAPRRTPRRDPKDSGAVV